VTTSTLLQQQSALVEQRGPASDRGPVLYVAVDLSTFEASADELVLGLAHEVTQRDDDGALRAYRRLDLDWYRWLYHQMRRGEKLTAEGRISRASWETMRRRFRVVWHWLRVQHSAEEIGQAEASYPDARYLPPVVRSLSDTRSLVAYTLTAQERVLHFNDWNYAARMEHAARGAVRLKERGITTLASGAYSLPQGMTYVEVIKVAEQVAREVAHEMAEGA
jgi:hypothetical protein